MLSIITWSVLLLLSGFVLGVGWHRAHCTLNHQYIFEDLTDAMVFEDLTDEEIRTRINGHSRDHHHDPLCLVHAAPPRAADLISAGQLRHYELPEHPNTTEFLSLLHSGSSKVRTTDWSDDILEPYSDYGIVRGDS